jgi:hypothetical protein
MPITQTSIWAICGRLAKYRGPNSRLLGRNRRHGFVDGGGNCFLFVLDGKRMKVSMGAADGWLRPLASMREGDRACILFL